MAAKKPVDAARRDSRGLMRLGTLPALNWILLAYAAVVIGIGWAYTGARIHGDYEESMDEERTRLRGVTAALEAGTLAMLNDGVGEAVAGANELQADGGLILASRAEIIATLRKQLAGEATSTACFSPTACISRSRAGKVSSGAPSCHSGSPSPGPLYRALPGWGRPSMIRTTPMLS